MKAEGATQIYLRRIISHGYKRSSEILEALGGLKSLPPVRKEVQAESEQAPALNRQLRHWEKTYNWVRPNLSLGYLTPLEFITRWELNLRKAKCH